MRKHGYQAGNARKPEGHNKKVREEAAISAGKNSARIGSEDVVSGVVTTKIEEKRLAEAEVRGGASAVAAGVKRDVEAYNPLSVIADSISDEVHEAVGTAVVETTGFAAGGALAIFALGRYGKKVKDTASEQARTESLLAEVNDAITANESAGAGPTDPTRDPAKILKGVIEYKLEQLKKRSFRVKTAAVGETAQAVGGAVTLAGAPAVGGVVGGAGSAVKGSVLGYQGGRSLYKRATGTRSEERTQNARVLCELAMGSSTDSPNLLNVRRIAREVMMGPIDERATRELDSGSGRQEQVEQLFLKIMGDTKSNL